MTINQQILLRYRTDGHARFQIPQQLCSKELALLLKQSILQIDGVYRVYVYRSQQKLSIRYMETSCSFTLLVKQLQKLFTSLEKHAETIQPSAKTPLKTKLNRSKRRAGQRKNILQHGKRHKRSASWPNWV